jgi:hypothetical protein
MDKHIKNDPNNPINYVETKEDKIYNKNKYIIEMLDSMTNKHFADYASDFLPDYDDNEFLDADEILDDLRDEGYFDEEIIYYSKAIKYLQENDASLSESIEIAVEMGYQLKNINSELLASLLYSRQKKDTFNDEIMPELEKLFNNYNI